MNDFLRRNQENIAVSIGSGLLTTAIIAGVAWAAKLPPIPVPAWLLGFVVAVPVSAWVYRYYTEKPKNIVGKKYGVERVYVDGINFINCEFRGTELVFQGKTGYGMERCHFFGPHFTAEGPAANTLSQLGLLYQDESFRPIVEATIKQIKTIRERTEQSD